jgi:hypothetical protein
MHRWPMYLNDKSCEYAENADQNSDISNFPKQESFLKILLRFWGSSVFNMVINLLANRYISQHIDRVVGLRLEVLYSAPL